MLNSVNHCVSVCILSTVFLTANKLDEKSQNQHLSPFNKLMQIALLFFSSALMRNVSEDWISTVTDK